MSWRLSRADGEKYWKHQGSDEQWFKRAHYLFSNASWRPILQIIRKPWLYIFHLWLARKCSRLLHSPHKIVRNTFSKFFRYMAIMLQAVCESDEVMKSATLAKNFYSQNISTISTKILATMILVWSWTSWMNVIIISAGNVKHTLEQ